MTAKDVLDDLIKSGYSVEEIREALESINEK